MPVITAHAAALPAASSAIPPAADAFFTLRSSRQTTAASKRGHAETAVSFVYHESPTNKLALFNKCR
jgi:hypothetical protein